MSALPPPLARRLWLRAQRLDEAARFGDGPGATLAAIEHLGYVQIDTIHVIERCHHHILFSRIPAYERGHLRQVQSVDRTVFEYWTHALSYVPTRDLRFYVGDMRRYWRRREAWFGTVTSADVRKVLARLRNEGAEEWPHWAEPAALEEPLGREGEMVHVLSTLRPARAGQEAAPALLRLPTTTRSPRRRRRARRRAPRAFRGAGTRGRGRGRGDESATA